MMKTLERSVSALIVLAAVAVVIWRASGAGLPAGDFQPTWLAGSLWNQGIDPYGPAIEAAARRKFGPLSEPFWFAYPAQWVVISRPLAMLSFHQARVVWNVLSFVALAASALMLWVVAARLPRPPRPLFAALAIAFIFTAEGIGLNFYLGQTAMLLLAGFTLLLYGTTVRAPLAVIGGVCLLCLKPQYGIVLGASAMAVPHLRRWLIIGAGITGIIWLAGHATAAGPLTDSIRAWLAVLGGYGTSTHNLPTMLSGPIQLIGRVPGADVPIVLYTLVAAAAGFLLVSRLRRVWPQREQADLPALWLGGVVAMTAIVPLHPYDFILTLTLSLLIGAFKLPARIALAAALVVIHRARTIARVLFDPDRSDALDAAQAATITVGIAVVAAVVLHLAVRPARADRA